MNRVRKLKGWGVAGGLALVALAGCAVARGPQADAVRPLKVLMVGNSFSLSALTFLPALCAHEGHPIDLGSLYIGGCSLETHWHNVEAAATNAAAGTYRYDRCGWEPTKVRTTKKTIPAALASEKWDVVTMQQASRWCWRGESYQPWADRLVGKIRELAPTAEVVVQQTWSYSLWSTAIASDVSDPSKPGAWKVNQYEMYARARTNYYGFAAANGFRVIPTGDAVQNYRALTGGDVYADCVGWPLPFGAEPGTWHDVIHLNTGGEYLQALVWYGRLFGIDPRTVTYLPEEVSAARAALLREAAAEALGCPAVREDVVGVYPNGDCTVELNPTNQLAMSLTTNHVQRMEMLAEDRKTGGALFGSEEIWRRPAELTFRWEGPEDCAGSPWLFELAEDPDFKTGRRVIDIREGRADRSRVPVAGGRCRWSYAPSASRLNLELGRLYYWRVTGNVRCGRVFEHGRTCACKERPPERRMATASFRTGWLGSRWIGLEGRVGNVRDLGGKKGLDGRRFRQGLVYRGQGLNDNAESGAIAGRNRLTVEDVACLTEDLGIRTDLDLRSEREAAGLNGVSPMGGRVRFVNRPSYSYMDVLTEEGRRAMGENFRMFADRRNYPFYFHCIAGADRTGALAYVLLGAAGVDHDTVVRDWEETFYPYDFVELNPPSGWRRFAEMERAIDAYGEKDDPFRRKVELYLVDCGVTMDEIEAFRKIVLE